jgi:hypothetical protein
MTEKLAIDILGVMESAARARRRGTLASELEFQAAHTGDEFIRFLGRIGEFRPVVEELRATMAAGETRLRLVVPQQLADAIERREWQLINAKDGSGYLPTVQDLSGKFTKQVRLLKERTPAQPGEIANAANAAAHARTHAMLREILAKLDVMDKKLDLLLKQQRNDVIGKISSGMRTFKMLAAEPGDDMSRVALLANAVQSIDEGRSTLLLNLQSRIQSEPVESSVWDYRLEPSITRAGWLDVHAEDIQWLYGAASTIAAIHSMQDRPLAARETMAELARTLAPLQPYLGALLLNARYRPERESFWKAQFSALCSESQATGFVIETSCEELHTAVCEQEK